VRSETKREDCTALRQQLAGLQNVVAQRRAQLAGITSSRDAARKANVELQNQIASASLDPALETALKVGWLSQSCRMLSNLPFKHAIDSWERSCKFEMRNAATPGAPTKVAEHITFNNPGWGMVNTGDTLVLDSPV
jgi:hypothetical protein